MAMFGIGYTEILAVIIVILLLASFAIGVAILYWIYKSWSGNRERKLEARIDALEKQLQEQQKK